MSVCELNRNSLQVFIPCGEFSFDLLEIKKVVQRTSLYSSKPYGGFWTSTLLGDFTTEWSKFLCTDFKFRDVGSKALVFSIAPNAKIYNIEDYNSYYRLIEEYPLETEKGTLLDWVAVSQDFDAVHANCYLPDDWDIESTVWFNLDALIFEGNIGIEEKHNTDEDSWNTRKIKLIPEPWMHYELVKVGYSDTQIHLRKNPNEDVYVYSAVPPNSLKTMRKYGLLSGAEVAKNKEVLHLARPKKKSREDFLKRVKSTLKSDYPYNMMGPSVLFTLPDEDKITDKHFIKEWNLTPIRINLTQLILDYPKTIIWGAELVPFLHEWRGLSDEEFEKAIEDTLGYDDWREWEYDRSHQLSLSDVNAYGSMSPRELWQYYSLDDAGKYYAANVPHAFIITPTGTIPYKYIDFL